MNKNSLNLTLITCFCTCIYIRIHFDGKSRWPVRFFFVFHLGHRLKGQFLWNPSFYHLLWLFFLSTTERCVTALCIVISRPFKNLYLSSVQFRFDSTIFVLSENGMKKLEKQNVCWKKLVVFSLRIDLIITRWNQIRKINSSSILFEHYQILVF